ncbi:hypothetical protein [Micrococcus luteus]|nr:hypothetical protein [Micrococcus luteus]
MTLPSGESIPVLGQGTWGWGEDPAAAATRSPRCTPASSWA